MSPEPTGGDRPTAPFELDPTQWGDARIELVEDNPKPIAVVAEAKVPEEARPPWLRLGLTAAGLFLTGVLALEAYTFLEELFARSSILGAGFTALLATAAGAAGALLGREVRSIRSLARAEELRTIAEPLLVSEAHGRTDRLLDQIERSYRGRLDLQPFFEQFQRHASDALSDGERLRLYSRTVLAPIDRRAYRLVSTAARDIGALTALSPLGLLDSAIVLTRTLMMLRAVARLYGVRPAAAGSVTLLRRALRNVLTAGAAEILSDAAVEATGAGLLGVLSAKAGQGALNALLAARLGLAAMQLCRPLPFLTDELPSMKQLRTELLQ